MLSVLLVYNNEKLVYAIVCLNCCNSPIHMSDVNIQ